MITVEDRRAMFQVAKSTKGSFAAVLRELQRRHPEIRKVSIQVLAVVRSIIIRAV